ncbi:4-oxalocrotonate tautomerase family protein [uncultured Jatrophihabitans sp.]|uniref:tautomerase family protein n=1 Tax=uncultured Jatrophihabitans sp. TaxID=1610747 RepID=UPI0035CBEE67
MPLVTVEWLAGRSVEQKQALAAEITASVSGIGQVGAADVWVIFKDIGRSDWAVGGELVTKAPMP